MLLLQENRKYRLKSYKRKIYCVRVTKWGRELIPSGCRSHIREGAGEAQSQGDTGPRIGFVDGKNDALCCPASGFSIVFIDGALFYTYHSSITISYL